MFELTRSSYRTVALLLAGVAICGASSTAAPWSIDIPTIVLAVILGAAGGRWSVRRKPTPGTSPVPLYLTPHELSHEIRTPLSAVVGTIELLENLPETQNIHQHLDTLSLSCSALEAVVLDLLDASLQSRLCSMHPAPNDVSHLCANLLYTIREKGLERRITVQGEIASTVPHSATLDRVRTYRLVHRVLATILLTLPESSKLTVLFSVTKSPNSSSLEELVCTITSSHDPVSLKQLELAHPYLMQHAQALNATLSVKASLRDGWSICIPYNQPGKNTRDTRGLFSGDVLVVTDSPSIAAYTTAHLSALEISRTTSIKGSEFLTLGTNLGGAKKYIINLDPRMAHYSELCALIRARGISDTVFLIDSLDEEARKVVHAFDAPWYLIHPFGGGDLRRCLSEDTAAANPRKDLNSTTLHVLVVDDVRVNRLVLSKHLESAGHSVVTAENGENAIEIIGRTGHFLTHPPECSERSFDVVIMDIDMPVLNGLATTERIRNLEQEAARHGFSRHLPIIAATADAVGNDYERFILAGMEWFIVKPIDPNRLFQLVEHFGGISKRRALDNEHPTEAIDLTWLREQFSGDEEVVIEIVAAFLDEIDSLWLSLLKSSLGSNTNSIRSSAHAIKGSLQNVGARAAAEVAKLLESTAKEGNVTKAQELVESLAVEIREAKESAIQFNQKHQSLGAGTLSLGGRT